MSLEQELKFKYSDFDTLRNRLAACKARFIHRVFEQNQVFDTEKKDLKQAGKLLRLRRAGKAVLCLKSLPQNHTPDRDFEVKVWEEAETQIFDVYEMQAILEGLGYREVFCYQKVREKWLLGSCAICLDRLPFGRFVEIEGDPQAIWEIARVLGHHSRTWTVKSYHELHQEWRVENQLPHEESFVFGPEEQTRIQAEMDEKG
ncbi:MAG: class IV adenylate cyclase [Desulfovermiculus sp.]